MGVQASRRQCCREPVGPRDGLEPVFRACQVCDPAVTGVDEVIDGDAGGILLHGGRLRSVQSDDGQPQLRAVERRQCARVRRYDDDPIHPLRGQVSCGFDDGCFVRRRPRTQP